MTRPIDHGQYRQTEYAVHGCTGKQRLDRARAQDIAARMRSRGRRGSTNASAYRCPTCNCWHVGSKPL